MQVCGAVALLQHLADRGLDIVGFLLQPHGVTQQHGHGGNGAQRVGDAFTGNVRSGAVHRFIEGNLPADSGGSQHAQRAGDHRSFIGEYVSEQIFGNDHIEAPRIHH